jgi:preprotein translocase subunit SecF
LTVFSQKDTATNTKAFPMPVVKSIMKDLVSGDSAKALLKHTQLILSETEKKVQVKDSIISVFMAKEQNYNKIIDAEKEKFKIQKNYIDKLELQFGKQMKKNAWITIIANSVAILTYFLTTQ